MAAGKSMKPFYAGLGVVAVVGIALIARAAMQKSAPPLTTDTVAPLASGPRGVVIGSDSARVEIMEFSDFECPYCGRFAVLQMPDVRTRLIQPGLVRWRFVHFPLQGHTKSPTAHLAAACANEQGLFWQMHDLIYEHQGEWTEDRDLVGALTNLAVQAGVDRGRFDQCMTQRSAWGRVLADKALGDSLGINGTPTFFVNGRQIPDVPSFDRLRAIVDSIEQPRAASR
jgi:protein-disulfide isomerase